MQVSKREAHGRSDVRTTRTKAPLSGTPPLRQRIPPDVDCDGKPPETQKELETGARMHVRSTLAIQNNPQATGFTSISRPVYPIGFQPES